MNTVYLIGALSEDPETHRWRDRCVELLKDRFNIINPADSIYDRELMAKCKDNPKKFYKWVQEKDSKLLLPKSYRSVELSDVLIVNLKTEPIGRPMIGTVFEIAWAWKLNKAMVGIIGKGFYSKHPMVTASILAWADDEKEACEIVTQMFSTQEMQNGRTK